MRIFVLYGTSEGHTREIANYVGDRLVQSGHEVAIVDAAHRSPGLNVADFDAIIIAARVHAGLYQRRILRFVDSNLDTLAAMPTAFLSVSMSAADLRPGDLERAQDYVDAFTRRTRWQPRIIVHVAGARLYTRHNALMRWILGLVDRKAFDTSKDHIWTDWGALDQFANDFVRSQPAATRTVTDAGSSRSRA